MLNGWMGETTRRTHVVAVVLSAVMASGSILPGQTPATGKLMREKLAHSEKVLEALMTSNFQLLARESEALSEVTRSPAWAVLKDPAYVRYSAAFLRATEDLREAARNRDSDAAALSYVTVTVSCYQCHRYMKGARLAK